MAGTGWLIRHELRRRWAGVLALALIVALGAGGSFVALGAARRTAGAYASYLQRADVGDVVLNPSLGNTASDALIRSLPGVRAVHRDVLLDASMDDGHPRTRAVLDADPRTIQVRGSTDGRFTRADRLAYVDGRAPTGRREAVLTKELAAARHVQVGDLVPVAFWDSNDDGFAPLETVLTPVGVEHLTVVGIGTMADEVLPDRLYPRGRLIVSPDVVARYDCIPDPPPPDATLEEAQDIVIPPGCATSYPYYSLTLSRGSAGASAALDAFAARAEELNAQLPPAMLEEDLGYAPIATTTAQEQARVERSLDPSVITLSVLAAGAGAVALVLAGLVVARTLRRVEPDQRQLWRLGMPARARTAVVAVPHLIALAGGLAGAAALAWLVSPVAPVGAVRSVDPSPGRVLSGWVLAAALTIAVVGSLSIVGLSARTVRRLAPDDRVRSPRSAVGRFLRSSGRPAVSEGVRAAFVSPGSGLVAASAAMAAGVLVAAVVFGASLSALVSTPSSYGWTWDASVMGGYGYGSQDLDAITATLAARPDVERWTGLGFGTFTLDGEAVVSMVGLGRPAHLDLTVLSGRLPTGTSEVALGSRTAAAHHVGVGDRVTVAGQGLKARRARVAGLVVLPALGPYQADRAEPGTGMVLPAGMFDPHVVAGGIAFIGLDLAPGAVPAIVLRQLHGAFVSWSTEGDPPFPSAEPIRPAEIANAASMRSVPVLVGALLAVAAALGLMFAVGLSVRSRRRELGTLRALGFTAGQLRASVRVQALTTTTAALVVGVPLGVVLGRIAWRLFATRLGVTTEPSWPVAGIAVTVVGGLVLASLAASIPARAAVRSRAAVSLRPD